MGDTIQLEMNWMDMAKQRRLIREGVYTVRVAKLIQEEQQVNATFCVQSEDPFGGWTLNECFNLESYPAKFYEFLYACGIQEETMEVELECLIGKVVEVTIKHRKDDEGTFWANISRFHQLR